MQIKNKVAIVTGAGRGIGEAITDAILQKGGKVVLSDIDNDMGMNTCEKFRGKYGEDSATFFKCDVARKSEQQGLFQYAEGKFGRIDIVCNNAGVALAETLETLDSIIDINLKGTLIGCMLALKHMKTSGKGVIINTSSAGALVPIPIFNVYSATKSGIVGYTRSIVVNKDIRESDIRVNAVCPMLVKTAMGDLGKSKTTESEGLADIVNRYGVVEPSVVAEGVVKLIEDDTMNGVALKISETFGFEVQ